MLRRDAFIGSLIVVNLVVMASSIIIKYHYIVAAKPSVSILSVPVFLIIGAKPEYLGKPQSPYTLVEYGDYQCPPCARIYPEVVDTLSRYKGRMKLEFRHYPLQMHPYALVAAVAAENARQQGKFWQMHDALYKLQGEIDVNKIADTAKALGVRTTWPKGSPTTTAEKSVQRDRSDGDKAGVEGTPTFILCCPDGKVVKLAQLSQVEEFVK